MTTVSYQASTELKLTLEDMVQYFCSEQAKEGELISGETVWAMIECMAVAKQEEFKGTFN